MREWLRGAILSRRRHRWGPWRPATDRAGPSDGIRFDDLRDRVRGPAARRAAGSNRCDRAPPLRGSRPVRIAVWHNLPNGGGKRQLYSHVQGLLRRGHHVEAWCPDSADRQYLPLAELVTEHVVRLDGDHE